MAFLQKQRFAKVYSFASAWLFVGGAASILSTGDCFFFSLSVQRTSFITLFGWLRCLQVDIGSTGKTFFNPRLSSGCQFEKLYGRETAAMHRTTYNIHGKFVETGSVLDTAPKLDG